MLYRRRKNEGKNMETKTSYIYSHIRKCKSWRSCRKICPENKYSGSKRVCNSRAVCLEAEAQNPSHAIEYQHQNQLHTNHILSKLKLKYKNNI